MLHNGTSSTDCFTPTRRRIGGRWRRSQESPAGGVSRGGRVRAATTDPGGGGGVGAGVSSRREVGPRGRNASAATPDPFPPSPAARRSRPMAWSAGARGGPSGPMRRRLGARGGRSGARGGPSGATNRAAGAMGGLRGAILGLRGAAGRLRGAARRGWGARGGPLPLLFGRWIPPRGGRSGRAGISACRGRFSRTRRRRGCCCGCGCGTSGRGRPASRGGRRRAM